MKAEGGDAADVGVDGGEVGDAGRKGGGDVEGVVGAEAALGHDIEAAPPRVAGERTLDHLLEPGKEPIEPVGAFLHPLRTSERMTAPSPDPESPSRFRIQIRRSREAQPKLAELEAEDLGTVDHRAVGTSGVAESNACFGVGDRWDQERGGHTRIDVRVIIRRDRHYRISPDAGFGSSPPADQALSSS